MEREPQANRRLRLVKAAPVVRSRPVTQWRESAIAFGVAFAALVITHLPLLGLPYFWDEAGYYVPAARDLLLTGDPIPHSTAANPHPPLVIASLAATWKVAGFSTTITRIVMLVFAALVVAAIFQLARRVANFEVAVTTAALTALYPVFFAQSTLAQLDVAAAASTLWGMLFYLEDRKVACAVAFSLAALAKETAIVAPLALLAWEFACYLGRRSARMQALCAVLRGSDDDALFLLIPIGPLFGWMIYQYTRTGHMLGDAEFVRYNLTATASPMRFGLALVQRVWHLVGHMNMYVLTVATVLAMLFPALPERRRGRVIAMPEETPPRQRIAIATQLTFAVVALAYLLMLSVLGGALLARYMLPVIPLYILICVSTLRRRVMIWKWVAGIVAAAFAIGLFVNPPYRFAPEDNLAYRDYVELHELATRVLRERYANPRVLTAWPATDELSRPYLGYVKRPLRVAAIENFSEAQIAAASRRSDYDVALVFSTKYQPPRGSPMDWLPFWRRAHERYFDYHEDLPPEAVAELLGGTVVYRRSRGGQWVGIVEFNRVLNAKALAPQLPNCRTAELPN